MEEYEKLLKKAVEKVKKSETDKRFEIPKVEVIIQGNQTIVKNFSNICSLIRRDPKHLLKYLTKELASPGSIDGQRATFQRNVPQRIMQEKLNSYIKDFVICKECGKPDTKLVKEDRILLMKCEACGARASVKVV